ncbi:MAG TPA: STAS domain-containing protein [Pyrinomonadaceae bacterium]|nr:STAS domain-containing protein [Pyrinomonadaceae bacterium]
MSNIGIKARQVGSITILDADGKGRIGLRFGGSTVPLPKAVQSLLDEGRNQIVLNLAGVVYIDAGGLGELVSTYVTVNEYGGRIKLLNLTEVLRELMKTTKLLSIFDVYNSESEAMDSFEEREPAPRSDSAVS